MKSDNRSVKLVAVGDIMFGEHPLCLGHGIGSVINKFGSEFIFEKTASTFRGADIVFGNLENMLVDGNDSTRGFERKYLRPGSDCVAALKYAGFNVVNLANNHALQHGPTALTNTIDVLTRHGIKHIGVAGYNSTGFNFGDFKIGFLGYCNDQEYEKEKMYIEIIDLNRISRDIQTFKKNGVDFVTVSLHWGDEFMDRPSPEQVKTARKIIELGANLILGHHPHVLQGIECYKGGIIVYSLGNFAGDMQWDRKLRVTMALSFEITKEGIKYDIIPAIINRQFQPELLSESDGKKLIRVIERLSSELNGFNTENPLYNINDYRRSFKRMRNINRRGMYRHYVSNLHRYKPRMMVEIFKFFLSKKIKKVVMAWKKAVLKVKNDPLKILSYLLGKAYFHLLAISNRNISAGKGLKIIGLPIIDIRGNCKISIGDNVVLNSRDKGYFAGLYGKVKLFADGDNAFIKIGNNTRIHGTCIHAYNRIEIGSNCLIAGNTTIVDSDGHDPFPSELDDRLITRKKGIPVIIEDNVWIGLNCIILKGVRIGEGSIIGAGSVVRESIPAYSIAIGNPARVVKSMVDSK